MTNYRARCRKTAPTWAAVVLLLATALPLAGSEKPAIGRALKHRGLTGAAVAALVVDKADGREVFAHNPDSPLIAASNVKVLTSLAALETFGPTHRFVTEIRADRLPDANGEVERLTIVGGGDPSLTSEQMWRIAANLARAGLRRVTGELRLDASAFDSQGWNPAWGQASARAYHAPVAALSVNYGAFTVEVNPGRAEGARARVALDPPIPYFTVDNRTATGGKRTRLTVGRTVTPDGDRVSVNGSVRLHEASKEIYRSVSRPVEYAGAVFVQQLAAHGIEVAATRRGSAAPDDPLLERFEGKPLSEVVRLCMKYSNNNMAESLLKAIGRGKSGAAGTWERGTAAMRSTLVGLGIDGRGFDLVDGSGLARKNRVTPRTLVAALRAGTGSYRYGPEFTAALPIAGRDGTLKKRASAARDLARAKTGLLTGATALSGIVQARDNRELLFSIIANGYQAGDAAAMEALDAFAAELAQLQR